MGTPEFQEAKMKKPVPPSASPEHPRMRTLIVDDTPQVLHDLRQLLELTGLVEIVAQGGNGLEAVHLAQELQPDAVIMDLEMPGLDGYEATRRIKTQHPTTRVIILSVHADPDERQRAREAGADSFVVKGARYETLMNAILGRNGESSSFDPEKGNSI
jgi:DNA-binding NarL/FixJ family response regulator